MNPDMYMHLASWNILSLDINICGLNLALSYIVTLTLIYRIINTLYVEICGTDSYHQAYRVMAGMPIRRLRYLKIKLETSIVLNYYKSIHFPVTTMEPSWEFKTISLYAAFGPLGPRTWSHNNNVNQLWEGKFLHDDLYFILQWWF